jgi:phytoene dehydrogenase-like protein
LCWRKADRAALGSSLHADLRHQGEAMMAGETFDAIVIGSGLGGLTAAALLARAGGRVLVLERNATIGGAASVYRRGALSIEASLHEMDGWDAGDPKAPILRALGLGPEIGLLDVGDLHEVRSRLIGAPLRIPHGVAPAIAALTARFPAREAAIRAYYERILAMREAGHMAMEHQDDGMWWLTRLPVLPFRLWPLIRDRNATVSEVFDRLFGEDEALKLAVAANLLYYDDDPDRMMFIAYAFPQASFAVGGGHYIRGGSRALAERLAGIVAEGGGRIETGREAVGILVEQGAAAGVTHRPTDGSGTARSDRARVVLGNAAPARLAAMLPAAARAPYEAAFLHRPLSISLFSVALGLDRPAREFGVGAWSTVILPDWMDRLAALREAAPLLGADPAGRIPPFILVDYGRLDTGLNDEGLTLATITGVDRLANWAGLDQAAARARREAWMDRLIGAVEAHFPGFAGAVRTREMTTAASMARHLNTPDGAIYGFAPHREAGSVFERGPRTPVPGLLHASAFTGGGGFTGAMMGGAAAARMAMATTKAGAP